MNQDHVGIPLYKNAKLKSILKTKEFTDCTFIVDQERIRVHKLILTCSSPVFEKMFYGKMASDEIELTEVDLEEFKQMLEYVYTDDVVINSVQNAWGLYNIAHKYLLDDLVSFCVAFIEKNLTMSTLALSYEYSVMYNEDDLKKRCWTDMVLYTKGVFMYDSDYHIQADTLKALIDLGNDCDTTDNVLQWAINECHSNLFEVTSFNIIKILTEFDLLKYLNTERLKTLTCHSFNSIDPSTCKECLDCLSESIKNFPANNQIKKLEYKQHWNFACKERQVYKIARLLDLQRGGEFRCNFQSNRAVVLFGLVINSEHEQTSSNNSVYAGVITISIFDPDGNCITNTTSEQSGLNYDSVQYIALRNTVRLEPNVLYNVAIRYTNLTNNSQSCVICHFMSHKLVNSKNNTVFQFNEYNGTVIRGLCYYPA